MQTQINKAPALGIPGEMGTVRPRYVYAAISATAITFGKPVGRKPADGTIGAMDGTTYTEFVGIAVSPHQHIQHTLVGPGATLEVPANSEVGIVTRGEVFIDKTGLTGAVNGKNLYVTSAGVLTLDAGEGMNTNVLIGTLVKVKQNSSEEAGTVFIARIGF